MSLSESDKNYFESYAHYGIHEEMLKDSVRTLAYRDAIYRNRHLFKDKVVLDVGCGSGILSMFAASAGAKQVIGVDMSGIIDMAREVIRFNHLDDKITLIQGKMEEITLPVEKVDIIISEWMGYFCTFESMLDTVIWARDRYLVKGGLILPDKAVMKLALIEDAQYKEERIGWWRDVYGFDYTPFQRPVREEPLVDIVDYKAVCSTTWDILKIDLYTVTVPDLAFTSKFELEVQRDDTVNAFVSWFDCDFAEGLDWKTTLSTSPYSKSTHWKQVVFYTPNDIQVNSGERFTGTIAVKPLERNPRNLSIDISYAHHPRIGKSRGATEFHYNMC